MDFKERIYQARKAKGFSQEDLAELVGVSRQAVSKWETGEAMPDLEKLLALCSALELNIEYLALGKMPEQKQPAAKRPLLLWLGASLLAVVCFVGGFLCGYRTAPQTPPTTVPVPSTTASQQKEPGTTLISDFRVEAKRKKNMELSILPAELTEGMEVSILCEEKIQNKTQTIECTFDGAFYRVKLPQTDNFHYYITAILDRNGVKEQAPLAQITGDQSSWRVYNLWKD